MKKVTQVLFDEERSLPVFVLEDGTVREPHEMPTGSCWALSWKENKDKKQPRPPRQLNSHDFEQVYKDLNINLDKLGCIMLDIEPLENMYSIELDGASSALYYAKNKDRFWINGWVVGKVAHVTLLYGLLEGGNAWKKHVDAVLSGWDLPEVEIEKVGYFESPYADEPYSCIVAHIRITDKLMEGHQRLELLPHINTFTGYSAHMTICYLDKAQGEGYRDRMIEHFNELWAGKKLKVKGLNYGSDKK